MNFNFERSLFGSIPYVDQWLGLWLMEPSKFESLASMVRSSDIAAHLLNVQANGFEMQAKSSDASGRNFYYREDIGNTAVIHLNGTLQKQSNSFSASTSTVLARRELRDAVASDKIGSILLSIDSPGGTSAGTKELADEIISARSKKPVFAHISDLGASAAYWIASAATEVTSNEAALVGSIGTYAVVHDMSALAAKEGVKVHVIKAGQYKGMGMPGTELTQDQLSEIQKMVDSANQMFLDGVALGRNMTPAQVQGLSDGRVHRAKDAKALGLIDGIESFDAALQRAQAAASARPQVRGASKMSVSPSEIRAACPGCSADFIVASQEANRDLQGCMAAYIQSLATDLAVASEQLAKANASLTEANAKAEASSKELESLKVAAAAKVGAGVEGLSTATSETVSSDETESYWGKVKELQSEGKTRAVAMGIVNKKHPELRAALVAAANK